MLGLRRETTDLARKWVNLRVAGSCQKKLKQEYVRGVILKVR